MKPNILLMKNYIFPTTYAFVYEQKLLLIS